MNIVFACAGTGGHVNPAIAMAKILLKHQPDTKILFIGTKDGLENSLVMNAGFEIKHISTGKIIRSLTLKNFKQLAKAYKGISDAKKVLIDFKADLIIGTGGYICVPVMLASKKLKIPYMLHESNAFPGVSVKLLAKKAKAVMIGFEDARVRLKNRKNIVYTGTPAKFDVDVFDRLDKEACKKELGLADIDKKIVLVTCGSQGAMKVNKTILEMVSSHFIQDYFVVLVTGNKNYDEIKNELKIIQSKDKHESVNNIKVEQFIFDMDKMYKAVDICITRAGALTVTELALSGKPAILIPLPTAAENHQLYNAKVLENVSAGKIIEQKDLTANVLNSNIQKMIIQNNIDEMSHNARKIAKLDVEEKIYKCMLDALKK
ncbi:MAG: undecaprenyldiphospho-muramoylpentapeptide beta-N-acetylglucosaminyltransferase [Clostridia bacterium]|nr:undecaprenyldiphospho-muramoylpentapeptide beta-N-acetylglucosaminyltransferase [Clostridia bacterium]